MAHRALAAHARRNGEVAMTDRARPLAPAHDTVAQKDGCPRMEEKDSGAAAPRRSSLEIFHAP
jgi:hypothetical protein